MFIRLIIDHCNRRISSVYYGEFNVMTNFLDISGERYHRWLVGSRHKKLSGGIGWFCTCDCGNKSWILSGSLRSGNSKSCGCFKLDNQTRHGMTHTVTYQRWVGMIKRCKPSGRYGKQGIFVCKRWEIFENFLEDMGLCPNNLTLDRYPDMVGPYAPDNCRWATPKEQAQNRRTTKLTPENLEEIKMSKLTKRALAKKFGVSKGRVQKVAREMRNDRS